MAGWRGGFPGAEKLATLGNETEIETKVTVPGGVVKEVRLNDGLHAFCLKKMEAIVLDSHVDGYLQNGIEVLPGDCVVDVGANIGLFAIRIAMRYPEAQVIACEPIPPIFSILEANAQRHGANRVVAHNLAVGGRGCPGPDLFSE